MTSSAITISDNYTEADQARLIDLITGHTTIEEANNKLFALTGIRNFFPDEQSLKDFPRLITAGIHSANPKSGREFGDFQTPPGLAARACDYLAGIGVTPSVVIEPSYGAGNFIVAALRSFPAAELIYGVEVQEKYEWQFKVAMLSKALLGRRDKAQIELHRDSIFNHCFSQEVLEAEDILIIGNPPWVTNAELGSLDSTNLPVKRNTKAVKGMDALTGKSNFDVGEYVLLKMIELLAGRRGTLAMLCKNSVIKNIVERLPKLKASITNVNQLEIDAGREFGASVEASLLTLTVGKNKTTSICQVASLEKPGDVSRTFGWVNNRFVSNIEDYRETSALDGESTLVWRQGIKHDCAQIMELECLSVGKTVNGAGESADVEAGWVYPLLKSSNLRSFEASRPRKKVLVTQRFLSEDTAILRNSAPKLWAYLTKNEALLERRKSSIYRNKPRFSVFGVGEYSFKLFKVGISGLYKTPCFSVVMPFENRPVMLDDTCYFLGFDTYKDALFTASLLNSAVIKKFLRSIIFTDAKRPYTKEALMRIDLNKVSSRVSFVEIEAFWNSLKYKPLIQLSEIDYDSYKLYLARTNTGLPFSD